MPKNIIYYFLEAYEHERKHINNAKSI